MPRPITKCAIVASVAGLLLAACGGGAGDPGPTAHVTVEQVFAVPTPYGEEGTASFVALERSGRRTTERFFALPSPERPETLFEGELETGSYVVRSYQRTCPASCDPSSEASKPTDDADYLDPPSAECEEGFELEPGSRIAVLVTLDPLDGSCEIHAGPPPERLTRALIEGGFGATQIPKAGLASKPAELPLRERRGEEIPAKVPALAGARIDLGGDATAYVYGFESEEFALEAASGFLSDSNYNEVSGCGRHIYYTDARRVPRDELFRRSQDSWQGQVGASLRKVDAECRRGTGFLVVA
jgi:hypothetical protein